MDADDLVELRKFSQLHEAEIAVTALEAASLTVVLRDSSFGGFRPETSIAGGGVTVLVRRDELEAAREVLDAPMLHDTSADAVTCANCGRVLQGTICPACDSDDEREVVLDPRRQRAGIAKLKLFILAATLLLLALPEIISRLGQLNESAVKTGLYAVAAVVVLMVVMKFFIGSSDERL